MNLSAVPGTGRQFPVMPSSDSRIPHLPNLPVAPPMQNLGETAIPVFPASLRASARKALVRAAEWATRNQLRDAWPAWNANKGRFPYHVIIDPARRAKRPQIWSTCWKTARAAQGLYCAAAVTGRRSYLDAADLAMNYVATLQVFDPEYPDFRGAFREDSPQGPHTASRDGMEALQGFVAGHLATRNERFLRRAREGADFLLRSIERGWFPFGLGWPAKGAVKRQDAFCLYAGVLPFAQLYGITGERRYLTHGAIPWADTIRERHVRADGALGQARCRENSHHMVSDGPLAGVYVNDDGLGVALLAVYAVTGRKAY